MQKYVLLLFALRIRMLLGFIGNGSAMENDVGFHQSSSLISCPMKIILIFSFCCFYSYQAFLESGWCQLKCSYFCQKQIIKIFATMI